MVIMLGAMPTDQIGGQLSELGGGLMEGGVGVLGSCALGWGGGRGVYGRGSGGKADVVNNHW